MDDNARRRRQNEPPFAASNIRLNQENQSRGFTGIASDRFRSTPPNTSPPVSRGVPSGTAYSGYYQVTSPSFPSSLQYQSTTGYSQDQRQQSQQSFATYSPEIIYNVPQHTSQPNTYNSASQFQARQSASLQLLPDVTNSYFSGETGSTSETTGLQHHPPTVYTQHQQGSGDRGSLLQQGYSTMAMSGMLQTTEVMEEEQFTTPGPGMDAAYASYQTALKEIFQNIIQGRLNEAGQSLVEISEWLLGHVADLGLTVDEVSLHADRIRLWGEFNSAWLGIFQKQKDLLQSSVRIMPPQSLIPRDFVSKMAKNLIRMCDMVEKYGLVDYQLGVAEEQIINILMEALDLQESIEKGEGGASSQSSGISRAPS
ncbi:hypothetical protein EPUL_002655 [Erysiphe pulchra]|uniref:Uncharacterized protein n=1 Tax=Erysiphe pulchra TaxID=225359 RepID=A0A2S4PVX6_9PEZI|nr:hypothetical protein EPUL_002655 [Erysiphe pulchra]